MAKINSRNKGNCGERELADWLHCAFSLEIKPERNLNQFQKGGADLIVQPFAFECKRVEKLDLFSWWNQINEAVKKENTPAYGLEPVVAFRQNNQNWEFLISGKHILIESGFVRLSTAAFKKWVPSYIERNYFADFKSLNYQLSLEQK